MDAIAELVQRRPDYAVDTRDYGQQVSVFNPATRRGCFVRYGAKIISSAEIPAVLAQLDRDLPDGVRNSRDEIFRFVRQYD